MSKEIEVPAPVVAEETPAPVEDGSTEELFRWLGRRDAFSLVAGRCSAADAEVIKRLRDTKLYLKKAKDWDEFCQKFLHMSKSNANHLLRLLDEFGPAYFYIAQVTRIGVKEYRSCIAPAVSERGLACDGETIGITPENSAKITQAVASLRAQAAAIAAPAKPETRPGMANKVLIQMQRVRGALNELRGLRYRHGRPDPGLSREVENLLKEVGTLLVDVR